ncbi:MAG: response regulator [Bacteroidetes bacterium]|nr:response regulator [Bacteroidota bacterium]
MRQKQPVKIFLVDDDSVFLKLLEIEFIENGDFDIETYESGEQCIKMLKNKPDIIILDYLLDGVNKNAMNGLATLDKIKEYDPEIPVIILSGQDKIEVAVNCMHHKATDYVVKSETSFLRLKKIINKELQYNKMEKQLNWYMERM